MTFDAPIGTESPPEDAVKSHGESNQKPEPEPVEEQLAAGEIEPGATESAAPADEVIGVRKGMFGVTGTGDTSGYGRLVRTVSLPGGSAPPYGGYFDELVAILHDVLAVSSVRFEDAIEKIVVFRDELTLHVRREHLPVVAKTLRDNEKLRFELCLGVNGAHFPEDSGRELHAVYHLNSITHNRRVRLEVSIPDADPHMPSLYSVYPTTDWHERETYDFFGILFDGHPSLTRISMPDDWRGHPQRKDYPLGGIPVEYKGARIPPPDERRAYS
ncbi:NADH-quinone oxidoreductase subunit C [Nocardia acidivorans]|uniref:NADH-quinone oxidoreductase subunit C n=1 Tax=Nocardia acidivorans TaxID=404580 RepID=UPI000A028C3A|nr:NADH-quinone oxidoreductase subunit C [Nocardia acidivorans]